MHQLEPFYQWRTFYNAEEDERSPFYQREHSELYFTHAVYDYLIHPQWDEFGSSTLYAKILYTDYDDGFCVIELIGEWNDAINNDIMFLKRELVEPLLEEGIKKFVLIGENVLNFHGDGDDYYQEWEEEVEEGWIVAINFREHILEEMVNNGIDYYLIYGGQLDDFPWRTLNPKQLHQKVESLIRRRLG